MKKIEITKREVIFSLIIIAILSIVGMFISDNIEEDYRQEEELYYKALRVDDDSEQFSYALKTKVGNTLVFGECEGISPVSIDELNGSYTYILKVTERYTKHTKTTTDSNGKTKTETTYSWDYWNEEDLSVDYVKFMGLNLPSSMFYLKGETQLKLNTDTVSSKYANKIKNDYIYEGGMFSNTGDLRHYYYVIPTKFDGTMFLDTSQGELGSSKAFYYNKDISETLKYKSNDVDFVLLKFRIFWILFIAIAVGIFYYAENKWLD